MVDIVPPPTTDINIYLRQGAANFHSGRHQAAFDAFEVALKLAKQQGDCSAERVCKQNIGALHIAISQPDQGLQHLLTALPSGNEAVDPQSLGDLYFNLGTGYEMIGNLSEASRHFIASAKEYHIIEECVIQEAEAYTRGAQLLQQIGVPRKAAQMFHLAADCYIVVLDYVDAAKNLCQEANSLITVGCYDDGLRAADECMILCQRITSYEMRAKLYNEVGVLYSQCGEFGRAAACLELSLPKHKIDQNDKRLEAMIRQNLGAVYNCLNEFSKALPLHQEALDLQQELGNRHAQCEIELNIAYAHAQLSDFNSAADHYELAYQAAHNTGDKHLQWQAMEGLAAAKFRQGDVNSAVTLYKEVLHILAKSGEKSVMANERLVAKLNDALQAKLLNSKGAQAGSADKATQDNKTIGADNRSPANNAVKPNDTRTSADVEVMQRTDIGLDGSRNRDKPPAQQEQISLGLRETNIINGSREVSKPNGKLPLTNGNGLPNAPSGSVGGGTTGQRSHEQSTDNSRLSHQNQQTRKKQTTEVKMHVTGEENLIKAYENQLRAKEREEQEAEDDDVDERVKYLRTQHTVVSQGLTTETQLQPPANAPPLVVHVPANIGKTSTASYDDPTYMSIRTMQQHRPPIVVEGDQPEPDPVLNTTNTLVPLVPQRMAMPTNWSRGAQEEFLFRYQQQYADDKRRERSEEEVQLQSKKKSDDPSKTCNLM